MGKMSKWRRNDARPAERSEVAPMKMQVETVTPEMALKWLAANPSNRPVSDPVVRQYAADMKAHRWKTTHQGIAFDRSGDLLDGQHRLRAVIRAGVPVRMLVFRDCDRATFDRLDTGRKRTAADALSIDGTEHARTLAAIARCVIRFGFKESGVTDAFVVEFAREHGDEFAEYLHLVPSLTAAGAAAFAFASTEPRMRAAADRLLAPGNRDMEDLSRCIKLMTGNTGTSGQRARYTLAMDAIRKGER